MLVPVRIGLLARSGDSPGSARSPLPMRSPRVGRDEGNRGLKVRGIIWT